MFACGLGWGLRLFIITVCFSFSFFFFFSLLKKKKKEKKEKKEKKKKKKKKNPNPLTEAVVPIGGMPGGPPGPPRFCTGPLLRQRGTNPRHPSGAQTVDAQTCKFVQVVQVDAQTCRFVQVDAQTCINLKDPSANSQAASSPAGLELFLKFCVYNRFQNS